MEIKISINEKEKISAIINIINEIEHFVIDYEFNSKEWCFNILTTPSNKDFIISVFRKYTNFTILTVSKT